VIPIAAMASMLKRLLDHVTSNGTNHKRPLSEKDHDKVAELKRKYRLEEELGTGAYGSVVRAVRLSDGLNVAVKIINKGDEEKKDSEDERLATEVNILRQVHHDCLVRLYEVFDTTHRLYLVMQLCEGGELFDRIVERRKFSEEQARSLVERLLSAVDYLHARGIVHRDLKPENILMVSKDKDDDRIAITDFGLAKFNTNPSTQMSTICGSPTYIAPEVLGMKGYTKACDLWSVGVITYILLCGYPPFYAEDTMRLFVKIRDGIWAFQSPYWDHVSEGAKDLVTNLICHDPSKRFTAAQALAHPWITGHASSTSVSAVVEALAQNRELQSKFRSALIGAQAMVRIKMAAVLTLTRSARSCGKAGATSPKSKARTQPRAKRGRSSPPESVPIDDATDARSRRTRQRTDPTARSALKEESLATSKVPATSGMSAAGRKARAIASKDKSARSMQGSLKAGGAGRQDALRKVPSATKPASRTVAGRQSRGAGAPSTQGDRPSQRRTTRASARARS